MKNSQILSPPVLALIFGLFVLGADANTKVAPTEAEPGHPFTIIDTPDGRLIDGSVAVFKRDGVEFVLPGHTHQPYNTMQGRLATDMYSGEYTAYARQPDGAEFEIGLFTVLGATAPPPLISPDNGVTQDSFTITDPLARIQSGDLVVFYAEGTDPVNQGVIADNIEVIDSSTITGKVPWGATSGLQNFVSVRPTLSDSSRFGDLGFFVTALADLGTVSALYSINGADWNNYVQGSDITNATDTACDAATDTACLNGGEIRMVGLTGVSLCAGITALDMLDAFNWTCDESTGMAKIISTGLKDGKGLANLLDFSAPGWAENRLIVYDGPSIYGVSNTSDWWSNLVMTNTTGGALGVAGTVYVVPSNTVATAYEFTASNVALVAAPGVVINGPAAGYGSYVIKAFTKDFLWIEGMTVNAAGDEVGVYWDTVRFSNIQNLTADGAGTGGVWAGVGIGLWSSTNNTLADVTASNNGYIGVRLYWYSNNNRFSGMTAINNGWIGIHLSDYSNNNTLTNTDVSGNEYGVDFYLSSNNRLTDVTATNNNYGVSSCDSSDNTLAGLTVSNNNIYGVILNCSSINNILMGVTASNNRHTGIVLSPGSSNNTLSNVTASNNGNWGIELRSTSNNYFTGELQVGSHSNKDCYVSGDGANPGLVDSSCANNGSSDATLVTGVTIANSFVAKVTADDTANPSDTAGTATITDFTHLFDWANFENSYRAWGVDGNAFPDTTNWGKLGCSDPYPFPYTNQLDCEAISGTWTGGARIWDWSLLATDTAIKDVLSLPTGNNTLTHTWSDLSTSTILRNAVEIQGDDVGNDNILCETGEDCLYTPNISSYQGHGSLISAGSIGTGGTLENITLMKYETNGY